MIREGTLTVGHNEDALTVAIGPDKGGRVKGAGFGVTATLYFPNGRKPRHSKENDELREKLKAKEKELESTKNAYQRLTDNLLSQGVDIAKIVGNSISKSGGEVSEPSFD